MNPKQNTLITIWVILQKAFNNTLPYQLSDLIISSCRFNLKRFKLKKSISITNIWEYPFSMVLYKNMLVVGSVNNLFFYNDDFILIKTHNINIKCYTINYNLDKFMIVGLCSFGKNLIVIVKCTVCSHILYINNDVNIICNFKKYHIKSKTIVFNNSLLVSREQFVELFDKHGIFIKSYKLHEKSFDLYEYIDDTFITTSNTELIKFWNTNFECTHIINVYKYLFCNIQYHEDKQIIINYNNVFVIPKKNKLDDSLSGIIFNIIKYNNHIIYFTKKSLIGNSMLIIHKKNKKYIVGKGGVERTFVLNDRLILYKSCYEYNAFEEFIQIWDDF